MRDELSHSLQRGDAGRTEVLVGRFEDLAAVVPVHLFVLPKEVRERLGVKPGTEVDIHEEDGKVVVEPEDDPEQILERMERLVAETASEREETTSLEKGVDPVAQKHRDAVRRGADTESDE